MLYQFNNIIILFSRIFGGIVKLLFQFNFYMTKYNILKLNSMYKQYLLLLKTEISLILSLISSFSY